MKKTSKFPIVVLMLVIVFCMCACGKENSASAEESNAAASDLVGTWKGTGNEISTLTLGANGSYKDIAGEDMYIIGTYTVNSSAGTLTVNESEYGMVFTYSYELSGDNLTLQMEGGLPRSFARQ